MAKRRAGRVSQPFVNIVPIAANRDLNATYSIPLGLFLHGTDFLTTGASALAFALLISEYTELSVLPVICAMSEMGVPLT